MHKKEKKQPRDFFKLLPIGLILAIIPLIVFAKEVKFDTAFAKLWKGFTTDFDFFSYYKMVWFMVLTFISVCFFFIYVATKKIKLTLLKMFIPLGSYLILVFLSSSFSKFHKLAFLGFPERYEGFFTILCYVIVCLICSILVSSEFDIKYLIYFLAFSVSILSIIGITQFLGFDFFQSSIGKRLILPIANQKEINSLTFHFPKQYIYSTLYNPNYVGGFFAIILSISIVIYLSVHKTRLKIISGVFCLLSFFNLVGCLSITGFISIFVSSIVILLLLRNILKRNILPIISISICFIATIIFMNFVSGGKVFSNQNITSSFHVMDVKDKFVSTLASKNQSSNKFNMPNTLMLMNVAPNSNNKNSSRSDLILINDPSLKEDFIAGHINDMKIVKYTLYLYTSSTDILVINFNPNKSILSFSDNNNKIIEPTIKNEDTQMIITFKEPRFGPINLTAGGGIIRISAPNTTFNLEITDDGFKVLTPSGNTTDIIEAESFGFKGNEHWGSNRGYIWSRSIPMLKDTILLGHGADTFAVYFPQNDYVAKMNYLNNIYTIVDKPHNLYLQIAINTGVISLLLFIVFIGWYYISALRLYYKGIFNEYFAAGVACLGAVTAFLVSSLANDSTITVSLTFWVIIGVGIACNRLYLKSLISGNKKAQL